MFKCDMIHSMTLVPKWSFEKGPKLSIFDHFLRKEFFTSSHQPGKTSHRAWILTTEGDKLVIKC